MKRFTYRVQNEKFDIESVPVLIPEDVYKELTKPGKGGEAPYEFIQKIRAPVEGDGGVYTIEFFESFIAKLAYKPIPGDNVNHSETPVSDFYTIGGKVEREAPDTANVYLRLLIPSAAYNGESNEGLTRDVKARIAQFSIVTDAEVKTGADGKVYITESLGGERNDRVEEGAMRQELLLNARQKEDALTLIERGAIDTDETDSTRLIVNGKVCRKAALRMQFNGPDKAFGAQLVRAIARKTNAKSDLGGAGGLKAKEERKAMNKEELLAALKAAIANNQLTMEEIAGELKMENKLRNATDDQRAKLAEAIAGILELPPDTPAEDLLKAAKAAFDEVAAASESLAEIEASQLANGRKRKNADGSESDNPAYLYIKNCLKGLRGEKFKNARKKLEEDPVLKDLLSLQASNPVIQGQGGAGGGKDEYAGVGIVIGGGK